MPPRKFCWTKFGAEAGQEPEAILARKEEERLANGGLFLWGIGSSIGPSLRSLVEETNTPAAYFTPMLSPPAERDRTPEAIGVWRCATGLNGDRFEIPAGSTVTSSINLARPQQRHWALVCRRDEPLTAPLGNEWLDDRQLRNLRSGAPIGASQVTSVVERSCNQPGRRRYRVAFSVQLEYPFQVTLTDYALT